MNTECHLEFSFPCAYTGLRSMIGSRSMDNISRTALPSTFDLAAKVNKGDQFGLLYNDRGMNFTFSWSFSQPSVPICVYFHGRVGLHGIILAQESPCSVPPHPRMYVLLLGDYLIVEFPTTILLEVVHSPLPFC